MVTISTSKNNLTNTQVIATSASKAITMTYPVLRTPYNEKNPPTDRLFYWFGGEEDKVKRIPDPIETEITMKERIKISDIQELSDEIGVDLSEYTSVNNAIKDLSEQGYYVVLDTAVDDSSDEDETDDTGDDGTGLNENDGRLAVDNFQDGKDRAPFNLQVRNTTGDPVGYLAVIDNVPYKEIPGLSKGEYDYKVVEAEKGYRHTFQSINPLPAYQGITITGQVPQPAGSNTGLTVYIK